MEDNNDLQPIHIFSYPFIYQQKEISLIQWKTVVTCYAILLSLVSMLLSVDGWFWSIWALQHSVALLNIKTGGWGRETSVFWCDVNMMFMKSYNTLRLVSIPCQLFVCARLFVPSLSYDQLVLFATIGWLLNIAEHENAHPLPEQAHEECLHSGIHKIHHEQHRLQVQRTTYGITWNALGTSLLLFFYTSTTMVIQYNVAIIPVLYCMIMLLITLKYLLGYHTFIQHEISMDIYQSISKTILFILLCLL